MNTDFMKEIVWHTLEQCASAEQRHKVMMTFIQQLGSEFVSEVIVENDQRFKDKAK
jgi:hypothetical protein